MPEQYRSAGGLLLALLLALAGGTTARAAGFQIQVQSVKDLGDAFAGGAAAAEDAATTLSNPAGLVLQRRQLELGANLILPHDRFHDLDSTNGIGGLPTGPSAVDGGTTGLVPNTYFADPLSNRVTFGLALTAPYGLTTSYPGDWIGRYHALKSELKTVAINPALGVRLTDKLSVGVGVSAQYANTTLTNAIDFGTLGFLAGVPGARPSDPAQDGFAKVHGSDWGFGYNLGVLYQFSPATRVGLAYRSRVHYELTGNAHFEVPSFAQPLAGPTRTVDGRASLTTPDNASLSIYHRINSRWAVMGDISWTHWSLFNTLRIQYADGTPDTVQPEHWRNTVRYAIGVSYKYSPHWTLRAGVAYDPSAISDATLRTPRVPDNSRRWVALGATYRPSPHVNLDFGYAHEFVSKSPIQNTETVTGNAAGLPVGSTLDGYYRSSLDIVSAQIQWLF